MKLTFDVKLSNTETSIHVVDEGRPFTYANTDGTRSLGVKIGTLGYFFHDGSVRFHAAGPGWMVPNLRYVEKLVIS